MPLGIEHCSSRIVCVPRALSQFLVELWNLLLMTQRGWSLVDRDNWAEEPIETIGQRGRTYWNGWLANFANFARPVRLNLKRPTVEQMQMNKYKWSLTQIHRAGRWIKCKYGKRKVLGQSSCGQILISYGQISIFWGRISMFWGQISIFCGQISIFCGHIFIFTVEKSHCLKMAKNHCGENGKWQTTTVWVGWVGWDYGPWIKDPL